MHVRVYEVAGATIGDPDEKKNQRPSSSTTDDLPTQGSILCC